MVKLRATRIQAIKENYGLRAAFLSKSIKIWMRIYQHVS
nr:hypothetical protein [Legionella pneumophila]